MTVGKTTTPLSHIFSNVEHGLLYSSITLLLSPYKGMVHLY